MRKRANGQGSITYNRSRRRYEVRVTLDGKRYKRCAATQQEAWSKVDELRKGLENKRSGDYTVRSWLDEWLKDATVAGDLSPVTIDNYQSMARCHIVPVIGHILLSDLKPLHVRQMLAPMRDKGLSPNTQRLAKSTLRRALTLAAELELVNRNAASFKGVGEKVKAKPGRSLTADQVRLIHADARETGDATGALVFFLVTTGLRRGEALGLRWTDVDLDAATLQVRRAVKVASGKLVVGETKTDRSRRTVDLPPETVDMLRCLCRRSAYVFTSSRGTLLDPANVTKRVKNYTRRVLGEEWGPHAMRHSCASLLISDGVPLKVVSDLLGHSSVTITSNVYGHLTPEARAETARAFSALLQRPPRAEESTAA